MVGVRFDMVINLGHVLTALAMLTAGFVAWSTVQSRITTIELRTADYQAVRDLSRDNAVQVQSILALASEAQAANRALSSAMTDIQRDVAVITATINPDEVR